MEKKNTEFFTLRDVAKLVSKATDPERIKAQSDYMGANESGGMQNYMHFDYSGPIAYLSDPKGLNQKAITLPHLCASNVEWREFRQRSFSGGLVARYKRVLSKMIQRHGPDKVVRVDTDEDNNISDWSFDGPTKGGTECETTKGGRKGPSVNDGGGAPSTTGLSALLKAMGKAVIPKGLRAAGRNRDQTSSADQPVNGASFHRSSREARGRGPFTGGEDQSRIPSGPGRRASARPQGGKTASASLQHMTARTGSKGDKQGVGVPVAAKLRDGVRPLQPLQRGLETKTLNGSRTGDVASPGSHLPSSPNTFGFGYGSDPLGDLAGDGDWLWGGGYSTYGGINAYRSSSFFNPHSFKGGMSSSYGSVLGKGLGGRVTSSIEWNTDGSGLSTEDKWRSSDPGGSVNALEAQLESKKLKKHAASIQRSMEECLVAMDVGAGLDPSPRMAGKKLIKELAGKSYRMARCQREEMQTGLKLVLVDISPSCSEIRDACYAAALSIAEADGDAVVVCHFNGRSHSGWVESSNGMDMSCMIVGKRQSEIPELGPELSKEIELWAANSNISGVIAFGDGDAASLYALLAKYMPLVWLFPENETYAKQLLANHQPKEVVDKNAKLWIVSNVTDAKTCVHGLRRVTKGGR